MEEERLIKKRMGDEDDVKGEDKKDRGREENTDRIEDRQGIG